MYRKRFVHCIVGVVVGFTCGSSLAAADDTSNCEPGFVQVKFKGNGKSNGIMDPTSLRPAGLGVVKLKSRGDYEINLKCGVRGVPVGGIPPEEFPDNQVVTKFVSFLVCDDDAHSEAVVFSTATLDLGICGPNEYNTSPVLGSDSNHDPIYQPVPNGLFDEPGCIGPDCFAHWDPNEDLLPDLLPYPSDPRVEGWGLFKDATGTFDIVGTSLCGIQDWKVVATVCLDEDLVEDYYDD